MGSEWHGVALRELQGSEPPLLDFTNAVAIFPKAWRLA